MTKATITELHEREPAVFSCRFECTLDYTAFRVKADSLGECITPIKLDYMSDHGYTSSDTCVEFTSRLGLEELRDIMRNLTDMHVGLQTLREVPLDENTLERDYSIE